MASSWTDRRLSELRSRGAYRRSVEGFTGSVAVKLDANENWNVPRSRIAEILAATVRRLDTRRYPEHVADSLREWISKMLDLPAGCVVPCTGGDQAIDLVCQAFLRQGDRAVVVGPTFSMYRLRAEMAGASSIDLQMNGDFTLPVGKVLRAGRGGGVLFLCSPNNPTGNQFSEGDVVSVTEGFPGLVVLDEAYVEFADFSLSGLVKRFRNLAVIRTFSKAYGMAGLRLGYLLANDDWAADFLSRVQYPYPVNGVAAAMAIELIKRRDEVEDWVAAVRRERAWLAEGLLGLRGTRVVDSRANFLMVSLPVDSGSAHRRLLAAGVATRDLGQVLGLKNCLRVTVGTRAMNRTLLARLGEVLGNGS